MPRSHEQIMADLVHAYAADAHRVEFSRSTTWADAYRTVVERRPDVARPNDAVARMAQVYEIEAEADRLRYQKENP